MPSVSTTLYEVLDDGAIRDAVQVVAAFSNPAIWGNKEFLPCGRDDGPNEWRGYKHFSISSLSGKTIISAVLYFYYADKESGSGGPPDLYLREIEDYGTLAVGDWTPTIRTEYNIILTNATGFGWINKDVKTALQNAINASKTVFAFIFMPLAGGNLDFYALAARNVVAYKAYISVTYCSTPATPTPATAEIIDAENIRINWTDNSSGESQETEFRIERKVNAGAYALLITRSPDVVEYIDNTVVVGNSYTYRIRASNQAGDSGWAETDTVSPIAGGMQGYMNC